MRLPPPYIRANLNKTKWGHHVAICQQEHVRWSRTRSLLARRPGDRSRSHEFEREEKLTLCHSRGLCVDRSFYIADHVNHPNPTCIYYLSPRIGQVLSFSTRNQLQSNARGSVDGASNNQHGSHNFVLFVCRRTRCHAINIGAQLSASLLAALKNPMYHLGKGAIE